MLSYSRARGVFVGASLEGAVLKSDEDANFGIYGERVSPRELLTKSSHAVPKAGQGFVDALSKYAPPKGGWK
jgi:lipid-binding SYLF domain-containing protein